MTLHPYGSLPTGSANRLRGAGALSPSAPRPSKATTGPERRAGCREGARITGGEGRGAREGHRGREEASKDTSAEWTQKRACSYRHTPACVPFGGELLRARFKVLLSWLVPLYSPFWDPFAISKS